MNGFMALSSTAIVTQFHKKGSPHFAKCVTVITHVILVAPGQMGVSRVMLCRYE